MLVYRKCSYVLTLLRQPPVLIFIMTFSLFPFKMHSPTFIHQAEWENEKKKSHFSYPQKDIVFTLAEAVIAT